VWFEADRETADLGRVATVQPIAVAAAEAAEEPGTEVAATQVAGSERGPRGRWVLLRRRRRQSAYAVEATAAEEASAD
jgi:hypothetical protein